MSSLKESGFTLLELLISITIIGIIVIIVSNAFRLGFRSIEIGEKATESLERLRSSFRIIGSQIESEIPLTYDSDGKKESYLKGDSKFLQLATNYSIYGGKSGYVIVKYEVEQDDSGKFSLFATEHTIGMEDERKVKLLSNFDQIYFEYFYKDPTEEEGEWIEEISEEKRIPEKILLHVQEGNKKYSFVLPLRISMQPSGQRLDTMHESF